MMRLLPPLVAVLAASLMTAGLASAQPKPEFKLGFKALAGQIADAAGDPIEQEHAEANGDSQQRTSKGLMVWRKSDNWTAFTNGSRTWVNGPEGAKDRANSERFPFETTPRYVSVAKPLYVANFDQGNCSFTNSLTYLAQACEGGEVRYNFSEGHRTQNVVLQSAPENFDISAQVRFTSSGSSPTSAGIAFNYSDDFNDGYVLWLRSTGLATLQVTQEGRAQTLVSLQAPVVVRDGGPNLLRVLRMGESIVLYVNGERLGSWRNNAVTGKGIGYVMDAVEDPKAEFRWTSFAVYPVSRGTSPTITTNALDKDWIRFEKPLDLFSISMPRTWNELPVDPAAQEDYLKDLRLRDPKAADAAMDRMQRLTGMGIKLYAIDLSPETLKASFGSYMNVIRQTWVADVPLEYAAELATDQIESLSEVIGPVAHRRVTLPGGEAEEFRYQARLPASGGSKVLVAALEYLLLNGRDSYEVSFAMPPDQAGIYAPIFEKAINSFEMK